MMDLSDRVFSLGMAYVALSRVQTIDGVHLVAFDPKSIMVSSQCLQESIGSDSCIDQICPSMLYPVNKVPAENESLALVGYQLTQRSPSRILQQAQRMLQSQCV